MALHTSKGLVLIFSLWVASSCSLFKRTNQQTEQEQAEVKPESISYTEYEKLKKDYVTLEQKYTNLKRSIEPSSADYTEDDFAQDLKKLDGQKLDDTVSLGTKSKNTSKTQTISHSSSDVPSQKLYGLVKETYSAISLYNKNNFKQALGKFQSLEQSEVPQIVVRAKYYMGEIFFAQKEYDLAMQMYEQIINSMAFSGYVIDGLKKLVACTEALGLVDKKMQYESLLTDVFKEVI